MTTREDVPNNPVNPLAVWANWYYFKPGEVVRFSRVESLCLLWPIRGGGLVVSGGTTFALDAGSMLVLPWNHDIEYRASLRRPFQLGTVHLIPDYRGSSVDFSIRVNVEPSDFVPNDNRFDNPRLGISSAGMFPVAAETPRSLLELGAYTIRLFQTGAATYGLLTSLGRLFARELASLRGEHTNGPKRLAILQDFIFQNLAREIKMHELAQIADCSVSALERTFRKELGVSPKAWISRQRMQQALFLLQSTSLNVSQVAFQVGYRDPLYFSKVFRQHFGASPKHFLNSGSRARGESA